MNIRLHMTGWLILVLLLGIGLAACGPAQDPDEEMATLTAVDEGALPEESSSVEEEEPEVDSAPAEEAEAPESSVEEADAGEPFDIYGGYDVDEFQVTDSGLQYLILEGGDGTPLEDGQIVRVHFTGWLDDGTEFVSSVTRGEPGSFLVGMETGLAGWDEAITLFSKGASGHIIIPPELAFGETGAAGIPPDTTLAFDLEVVDVLAGPPDAPQEIDEADYTVTDSGLKYYDFEEGDGPELEPGQPAAVHYTGWLEDGQMFDSSLIRGAPLQLILGGGQVIPGWDEGLMGMKVGGKRQLVIPPELAYGEEGAGGVIPPNAVLIFEVEIVPIEE